MREAHNSITPANSANDGGIQPPQEGAEDFWAELGATQKPLICTPLDLHQLGSPGTPRSLSIPPRCLLVHLSLGNENFSPHPACLRSLCIKEKPTVIQSQADNMQIPKEGKKGAGRQASWWQIARELPLSAASSCFISIPSPSCEHSLSVWLHTDRQGGKDAHFPYGADPPLSRSQPAPTEASLG